MDFKSSVVNDSNELLPKVVVWLASIISSRELKIKQNQVIWPVA